MDEKVLREIKIVETEDGFRIEMKGDKEELRKLIFDQSRPFFAWGSRFGGRAPFGEHNPFEHLREMHERHQQQQGHEHQHGHGPFGFRGEGDPRVEALRAAGRNWKFKRGGYDMGPWWDEESAAPDEPDVKL